MTVCMGAGSRTCLSQTPAYEVFNYTLEKNITIDALVNNAGFGDFGNFWEVDAQRRPISCKSTS